MMMTYLGFDPAQQEIDDTSGCHVRFSFFMKNYVDHLNADVMS